MEFLSILSDFGHFRWNDSAINVGPKICGLLWPVCWAGGVDDAPLTICIITTKLVDVVGLVEMINFK